MATSQLASHYLAGILLTDCSTLVYLRTTQASGLINVFLIARYYRIIIAIALTLLLDELARSSPRHTHTLSVQGGASMWLRFVRLSKAAAHSLLSPVLSRAESGESILAQRNILSSSSAFVVPVPVPVAH